MLYRISTLALKRQQQEKLYLEKHKYIVLESVLVLTPDLLRNTSIVNLYSQHILVVLQTSTINKHHTYKKNYIEK